MSEQTEAAPAAPQYSSASTEFLTGCVDMESRTLYLGDIDDDTAAAFIKALFLLCVEGDDEINVIINSSGGDWFSGLAIYDAIRSCNAPVTCVVMGKCMSMAVPIAQACTTRYIHENAVVMVHNGHSSLGGDALVIEAWGRHNAIERERLYRILAKKSTKKPAYWRRKCAATGDYILTAQQATKLALFDALIEVED